MLELAYCLAGDSGCVANLESAARKLRAAQDGVPRAEERAAKLIAEARAQVKAARAEMAEAIRAADRDGTRQVDRPRRRAPRTSTRRCPAPAAARGRKT